jgi:hypothetical protein
MELVPRVQLAEEYVSVVRLEGGAAVKMRWQLCAGWICAGQSVEREKGVALVGCAKGKKGTGCAAAPRFVTVTVRVGASLV